MVVTSILGTCTYTNRFNALYVEYIQIWYALNTHKVYIFSDKFSSYNKVFFLVNHDK